MKLIPLVILVKLLVVSSEVLFTVTNDSVSLYWDIDHDRIMCFYLINGIELKSEILYYESSPYTIHNLMPNTSYELKVAFANKSESKYHFQTKSNFFGPQSVYCSRNQSELYVEWHETDYCAKFYLVSIKAINQDNTSTITIKQKIVSSIEKSAIFSTKEDYPKYWASVQTLCYSEYSPEVIEFCHNINSNSLENPVSFDSKSLFVEESDSKMSYYNFYYFLIVFIIVLVIISTISVFKIFKLRKILQTSFSILSYGKLKYFNKIQDIPEIPTNETLTTRFINSLDDRLRYNIEDLEIYDNKILGKGQFGNVHYGKLRFNKSKIKIEVAVKVSKYLNSEDHIEDINKEALIMQNFDHDNVLRLIGICINESGIPLIILPYLRDGDLISFLNNQNNVNNGKLNQKQLTMFGIDVAKGMKYLAEKRVVHRDLAARNCMIDFDQVLKIYHVKVSDFGLSRDISDKYYYRIANPKQRLPTKWMAIECFQDHIFTTQSDVWSFGIVLWEIYSLGTVPYPQFNSNEVFAKLREGYRLDKPLNCSESIFQLMSDCWLTDPKERPDFTSIINILNNSLRNLENDSVASLI